jgi:inosine/xanthosine triphosphate pyrophosphatase family protein
LPDFDKTMAELTLEEKSSISHRGKAALQAHKLLMSLP